MVNDLLTPPLDDGRAAAERDVVLAYAPAAARAGFAALLNLDDQLGAIVRTTREPMIGQMRLTWWHDALTALDGAPPPAHPVLRALADHVVPIVPGARLADMIEGWEGLLDPADMTLDHHAARRGGGLFTAAAAVLDDGDGGGPRVAAAGEGWALAWLAERLPDGADRLAAATIASARFAAGFASRWPRPLRPLGAMALLAARPQASGAARIARILAHRFTGL